VAFGIEMGEVADVEWRLGLSDVNDHDLTVWIATADHDPAGVQEPVDAFGGETVDALTDGHRAGDRVEETMIPPWGLHFDGLPPAGSPGKGRHEAGAEQQRDRDHLGDRVDPQRVVGGGQEEVLGQGGRERRISPAARPPRQR
jgi:hypothetical protein